MINREMNSIDECAEETRMNLDNIYKMVYKTQGAYADFITQIGELEKNNPEDSQLLGSREKLRYYTKLFDFLQKNSSALERILNGYRVLTSNAQLSQDVKNKLISEIRKNRERYQQTNRAIIFLTNDINGMSNNKGDGCNEESISPISNTVMNSKKVNHKMI